ncbi:hypothetical protein H6F98_31380 [Microcoleus sp. FACHB-SPT15]|jgi:hypothetical protein|uniref:hypothetical protein n=1 Tax=Microcoleus sp. FACHB-SPT15 TaxID=2692830 RepID=UPI0017875FB8|nr:hypothetical protein [Microcoleus sp. FACHB-SPT15]MBD1809917.1 hypothetical protein [Microcoleus sp. FACHB-SPT15]
MAGDIQGQFPQTLKQIVDRILNSGQLSRLDHLQLVTTMLSDYRVTDEERHQINRVFDDIQTGRIKILD